jgi:hypothetical protein
MSTVALVLTVLSAVLVLVSPRRWAAFPLLLSALCVPRSQVITLASANFQVVRIIVPLAILRVILRGERIKGPLHPIDRCMVLWSAWLLASELIRTGTISLVRFGDVYTILGSYFLFRVFIQDIADIKRVFKIAAILLVPIAIVMIYERVSGFNLAASIFNDASDVVLRKGRFRARGPYANAILAGTVAAVSLPIACYFWLENKVLGIMLALAAGAMIFASASSGPAMTAIAGSFAAAFWKFRPYLPMLGRGAVVALVGLQLVMSRPVYYLVAYIDIGGGSTGWYRAKLLDGAVTHWTEWLLIGTDQTQHWVPEGTSGVTGPHADITNHFVQMGVWGGIVLMALFIRILLLAFRQIGESLRAHKLSHFKIRFLLWVLGSVLFAHVVTFWSVSYFDPAIIVMFYLLLAAIASLSCAPPVSLVVAVSHPVNANFA